MAGELGARMWASRGGAMWFRGLVLSAAAIATLLVIDRMVGFPTLYRSGGDHNQSAVLAAPLAEDETDCEDDATNSKRIFIRPSINIRTLAAEFAAYTPTSTAAAIGGFELDLSLSVKKINQQFVQAAQETMADQCGTGFADKVEVIWIGPITKSKGS